MTEDHPLALAEAERNAEALADVLEELHREGRVEALTAFFCFLQRNGDPRGAIEAAWKAAE